MNELRLLLGTVKDVSTKLRRDRKPYIQGFLHTQSGESWEVLWWEVDQAPQEGSRVRLRGKEKVYEGRKQIHARQTYMLDDQLACLTGFYRDCLEAESAESLRVFPEDNRQLLLDLETCANPVVETAIRIPSGKSTQCWLQLRKRLEEETLIAGYPLVQGRDPEDPDFEFTAPLLFTEIQLREDERGWQSEQLDGDIELNPYALELLGVDRESRYTYVKTIETSPAVEEASSSRERVEAILKIMADVLNQSGLQHDNGIQQRAVIMATTGSARFVRMLVEDLDELANKPGFLQNTPAAILLGRGQVPPVPLPRPHPALVFSSLRQYEAVHAAMENVLTVVTGPPGTGKSQVLVNVVAAAVAEGQKVLFASKNNKAVDVVVERLREVSPEGIIVRTGASSKRNEVPDYVTRILSTPERPNEVAAARGRWRAVAEQVQKVFQVLHDRRSIQEEMVSLNQAMSDCRKPLPSWIFLNADPKALDFALQEAQTALDEFGNWLGLFCRRRRHRKRLEGARSSLAPLKSLMGIHQADLEECLAPVAERPTRSLAPRQRFRAIEEMAANVLIVQDCTKGLQDASFRLNQLPAKSEMEDLLQDLNPLHTDASRALIDSLWNEVRWGNRNARAAAKEYCDLLAKSVKGEGNAFRAASKAPASMPVLPVWAVTNLSVRNNLPLQPGLFDLVVIDEASQCDIASALPLLVRGARALVIGDAKQLIHITSLRKNRERRIAERWGLSEEQTGTFSYVSRSCFDLASTRVKASPIFLDMHFRSPPGIIGFADTNFYGGKMEWCNNLRPPNGMRTVNWVDVQGASERGSSGNSWINQEEARAVAQLVVQRLPIYREQGLTVGIVTPFRAQAQLIQRTLSQLADGDGFSDVLCATAHRFQGDERDLMYFSPVVSNEMPELSARFASDPNLVNVALTRAARQLVIVGDQEACIRLPGCLKELADYVTRLESQGFDSPIELQLFEAFLQLGIRPVPGKVVGRYRLDLAIEQGKHMLDVECDGYAFYQDGKRDEIRDRNLVEAGWKVVRYSGRQIQRDPNRCAKEVADILSRSD